MEIDSIKSNLRIRVKYWILEAIPYFMRTWPFIRRYYWQKEDIERAAWEAKKLRELINWGTDRRPPHEG